MRVWRPCSKCRVPLVVLVGRPPFLIVALPTYLLYVKASNPVQSNVVLHAMYHLFLLTMICHLSHPGSRTLSFAEHPYISTELCLVESHIDFTVYVLKLTFVTSDNLLILDCLFNHLIWSDVMIKILFGW